MSCFFCALKGPTLLNNGCVCAKSRIIIQFWAAAKMRYYKYLFSTNPKTASILMESEFYINSI